MKSVQLRLAVYQPDIPQNVGAMIRLSSCFGIEIDIIGPCSFPFSKKVLKRTAMDYFEMAKIRHHTNYDDFSKYANNLGRVVLLSSKASTSIWDFKFKPTDILMVGSESSGVPHFVSQEMNYKVKIPLVASARCLNVANAASIGVAEAVRQGL